MGKFTNIDKGPRGLNTTLGKVWADPGETVDVDLAPGEEAPADWFKTHAAPKPQRTLADDIAEVLAMADDPKVHFQTFRAEARKILGDDTPEKKDEILAALEALG